MTVWTPRIADPFIFPHDANAAVYSLAARNHLRLGLAETRGANCLSVEGDPCAGAFYVHHPGTLSLLVAASFAVLGESEAAARLVPVSFSLAGLVILHGAVRRRWDARTADLAGLFVIVAPLSAFFAKMVNFEPLVLPLGVLAVDRYARGVEGDRRAGHIATVALAAAEAIDHTAPTILVGLLAWGARRAWWAAAAAVGVVALANVAHVAWVAGGDGLAALAAAGARRAAFDEATAAVWADRQVDYLLQGATRAGCLAALVGAVALARGGEGDRRRFVAALALWGAAHVLLFPGGSFVHDYWQMPLVPAVAVLFALGLRASPAPVALAGLVWFAGGAISTLGRYHADVSWYEHEFAAVEFARHNAGPGKTVLTRDPLRTHHAAYYADRRFVHDPTLDAPFAVYPP